MELVRQSLFIEAQVRDYSKRSVPCFAVTRNRHTCAALHCNALFY